MSSGPPERPTPEAEPRGGTRPTSCSARGSGSSRSGPGVTSSALARIIEEPAVTRWWRDSGEDLRGWIDEADPAEIQFAIVDPADDTRHRLPPGLRGARAGLPPRRDRPVPHDRSAGAGSRARRDPGGGPLARRRARPPPDHDRPGRRQPRRDPGLRAGGLPAGRGHAPVRARCRRHLARRPAHGAARRRAALTAGPPAATSSRSRPERRAPGRPRRAPRRSASPPAPRRTCRA